jgi:hypothetical protein
MTFDDLLAPIAGELYVEDALESWGWLGVRSVKPLLVTALGDVFVLDPSQSVWFLDIIAGTFRSVAPSVVAWEAALRDPDFVDRFFAPGLVSQLRDAGSILAQGECYVPRLEPVLGGSWTADNWSTGRWVWHLERQGRVHFAIKDIPSGTKITKWNYTEL